MQVSEEVESRSPSPVVQLSLCKDTEQSGLPRVHVTQHSDPQVQELETRQIMPLTHTLDRQTHQMYMTRITRISNVYLLIVWHFSDQDLGYSVWLVRVVIDLPLSENCDVCTHPEQTTNTQHYLTKPAKNMSAAHLNILLKEYLLQ